MLLTRAPTKLGLFRAEHAAILGAVVSGDSLAAGQFAQRHALSSADAISGRIMLADAARAISPRLESLGDKIATKHNKLERAHGLQSA
jgi:hypothetical protein